MKRNLKVYRRYMELETLSEAMAQAMRSADMPYVATTGRLTPAMEAVWSRYVLLAQSCCKRREMSTTCVVYEKA